MVWMWAVPIDVAFPLLRADAGATRPAAVPNPDQEYYLAHPGHKPTAELQPIYARHAAILGEDSLAFILEAFRGAVYAGQAPAR